MSVMSRIAPSIHGSESRCDEMADAVIVRLVCGCLSRLGSGDDVPYCAAHDERRVGHVTAPPPRIRAVDCDAKGPLVSRAH